MLIKPVVIPFGSKEFTCFGLQQYMPRWYGYTWRANLLYCYRYFANECFTVNYIASQLRIF